MTQPWYAIANKEPVVVRGGRATGRQDWRRLERFAEECQDLPNRPRTVDERDEPDVAAARGARKLIANGRKLWPRMLERRGAA